MIKLLAIDMDGTLLNEEKHIDTPQKEAVQKAIEDGIKVVLCTGRPLFGVLPVYGELELEKYNLDEYVILNNGCSLRKTTNWELLDNKEITKEDVIYLDKLRKGYNLDLTVSNDNDYFVVGDKANKYTIEDGKLVYVDIKPISLEEATSGKHTFFKSMYLGEEEEIQRFKNDNENLLKDKYDAVLSQIHIFEMLPFGTNKAAALKELAEKLGIEREEIMTIGDGNNDVEMLEFAGIGVAMGNGTESAKKAANYVTDTNENHGVAKAIEKYILSKN
ncbi:Cof-type HAD-IIB family hydrolase [Leptotrichia sp.]|uniref:Cof-type HAD-IIB family hydrolase n=1 Tax=Leptotrichia sp. TaxID=104608 RepID=UPI001791528B|nr:Cof-type HAD-IIB family hydrolase [Leptotrichia sp.]MBB1535182.1 HAD family phosphatase [Leptotrichia sp.]